MNPETELPAAATPSQGRGSLTALMIVSGIGGIVLGTILASSLGAALADGLGLGQLRDRLDFTAVMGVIGAPTGLFVALWLVLRARLPDAPSWHFVVGIPATLGLAALAIHGALFAALTPPPPVLPYLTVEIRITPGATGPLSLDDTQVTVISGLDSRGGTAVSYAKDTSGRDIVRSTFWLHRHSAVESLALHRRGKPSMSFTLRLPADPPSTGDFTHWLNVDAPTTADVDRSETAELRFRIDRRVSK